MNKEITKVSREQSSDYKEVVLKYSIPEIFNDVMTLTPQCLFDYYNILFPEEDFKLFYRNYLNKLPIEKMIMIKNARMKIWRKIRK